jgi:hypothetical protein
MQLLKNMQNKILAQYFFTPTKRTLAKIIRI